MYFDAVSPSNPLAKGTDRRDTQCIYFTFLELGCLSDENAWLTPAACRNYLIKELPGAMSHFFKIVMGLFFGGKHDFARTGVVLEGEGEIITIFAKHSATIADYAAHTEVNCSLGQSATKCCPSCRRVVNPARARMRLEGAGIVPLSCTDPASWREHTDASLHVLLGKLQEAADRDAASGGNSLAELETLHGYRHEPHNIMHAEWLGYKAVSTCIYDWMHCWTIDGVFYRTLQSLMETLKIEARRLKYEPLTCNDLHDYHQLYK
jgi:hypothetical protein